MDPNTIAWLLVGFGIYGAVRVVGDTVDWVDERINRRHQRQHAEYLRQLAEKQYLLDQADSRDAKLRHMAYLRTHRLRRENLVVAYNSSFPPPPSQSTTERE